MILDKIVKMKWNGTNIKYYIEKGYVYTNFNDEFEVNVNDIQKGSNKKINVQCDRCNTEKNISICDYFVNKNNGDYYACCEKCASDKKKKTCLENYGVEHPTQNKAIFEKIKENNLIKFGVEFPAQNIEIFKKVKETNLIKYGFECSLQNIDVKNKSKETNLIRYGVENPNQNKSIIEKRKRNNLIKYGYEHTLQVPELIEQRIKTSIEKYGEKYFKYIPSYNINSIIFLDMISEKINLHIHHALNGGEKKFERYWVDGYNEQYNIIIEWDEKSHDTNKQKEKDLIREQFIIEKFNCKFFRIKEKEFLLDIENNIQKISKEILDYINSLIIS